MDNKNEVSLNSIIRLLINNKLCKTHLAFQKYYLLELKFKY
jgi:hypothetical protein